MPLLNLPLDLPGEDVTQIMQEVASELAQELDEMAKLVYSDGIFPGTRRLSDRQKLINFLNVTDPQDYQKLFDEDYLLRLQNGLESPPVSKFWLNQMSIRESYDRNRREFMRLLTQMDRPTLRKAMIQ